MISDTSTTPTVHSAATPPATPRVHTGTRAPAPYRAFQVVYAGLALNFILPAISYIASPETTLATADRVNRLLGGGPYPVVESGHLWHMLAVGNVMTLGFMCTLLLVDLRRFYPTLPALVFLKMFSSLYSLVIGIAHGLPFFLGVFALDLVTSIAMWLFATRAHRALTAATPTVG